MWRLVTIIFTSYLLQHVHGSFPKAFFKPKTVNDPFAVNNHKRRHDPHAAGISKPKPPMLELMSLRLETWGTKATNNTIEKPPGVIAVSGDAHFMQPPSGFLDRFLDSSSHSNPLAPMPQPMNMYDPRASQPHIEPINFNLYSKEVAGNLTNMIMVGIAVFLVLVGLACIWSSSCADYVTEAGDDKAGLLPKESKGKLSEGSLSQSSWARAYLEAEGEQKEALELLFRCNIISTEELACGVISQEHIQECTWIATHMLQHRPLEEWVALWQQAQLTFEDSVAQCFQQPSTGDQAGLTARALAQRLKISRAQQVAEHPSPSAPASIPSSANDEFVSHDFRPLNS